MANQYLTTPVYYSEVPRVVDLANFSAFTNTMQTAAAWMIDNNVLRVPAAVKVGIRVGAPAQLTNDTLDIVINQERNQITVGGVAVDIVAGLAGAQLAAALGAAAVVALQPFLGGATVVTVGFVVTVSVATVVNWGYSNYIETPVNDFFKFRGHITKFISPELPLTTSCGRTDQNKQKGGARGPRLSRVCQTSVD